MSTTNAPKAVPGPYTYDADAGTIESERTGTVVATVSSVADFPCLDEDDDDLDALEADLNATGILLAAAPDLLEAARAVRSLLAGYCLTATERSARATLDAAIAKAEG